MNETVTNNDLKKLVISQSGMEPAFVNIFIDQMCSIISEAIENGEDITIDGIGQFRTVSFEKGDKKRVVFIPDQTMRSRVNSPFEAFEPIIIGNAHQDDAAAPIVGNNDDRNKIGELNAQTVVNNTDSGDILQNGILNNDEPMENNENLNDPNNSEKCEENIKQQYEEQTDKAEAPIETSNGNANLSQEVEKAVEQPYEEIERDELRNDANSQAVDIEQGRSTLWGAIILLAIAIIGTIIYFIYVVDNDEKSNNAVVNKTEISAPSSNVEGNNQNAVDGSSKNESANNPSSVADDNNKGNSALNNDSLINNNVGLMQKNTASGQSSSQNAANADDKKSSATKDIGSNASKEGQEFVFPTNEVLESGQRLTLLSLKYYGNKVFWVYIYIENKEKYHNPDNIPVGAELVIPSLKKYGIDCQNPESLNKAKQLATEILNK